MKLNKNNIEEIVIHSLRKGYVTTSSIITKYHPKLGIFLLALGQRQPDIRKRFEFWNVLNKFKENLKKENKQ